MRPHPMLGMARGEISRTLANSRAGESVSCQKVRSFNHLVGAANQRIGDLARVLSFFGLLASGGPQPDY
jgi:hypothetical protein